MRARTNKLAKLEKSRYSILESDSTCFLCGSPITDMHEVFGGSNRKVSMENGLCVHFCRHHHSQIHNDKDFDNLLKRLAQKKFEETHTREEFMALIGKNYL